MLRFPPYCAGTAYSFANEMVEPLFRKALTLPLITIEDAFISGNYILMTLSYRLTISVLKVLSEKKQSLAFITWMELNRWISTILAVMRT